MQATGFLSGTIVVALCMCACFQKAEATEPDQPRAADRAKVFRAGAAEVDISPKHFPVIVSGSFLERTAVKLRDPLYARAFALDDGKTTCVICIVDSLFMPRDLLDRVKRAAAEKTGVAADKMLIAATHSHTAPSVAGALGTGVDEAYKQFLPGRLVEVIEKAVSNLQPAVIGWGSANAPAHTHCRRWIMRPDRMRRDVFGERTVRANMHPGYRNPDFIGPAGPADSEMSVLSLKTLEGEPLALLANYSMHYFGSSQVSADYYGCFVRHITRMLGADQNASFVAAMSQGTSGDLHWYDYSKKRESVTMESYAQSLAEKAAAACRRIEYKNRVSLAFLERKLKLRRRVPGEKRLSWAHKIADTMQGRKPRNRQDVYALEQLAVAADPVRELKLQVLQIGELALTAIPCEVYGITGMKLKLQSPLADTFNLELANGAEGYIPPPEQHALGGYTTWAARSAGLETTAEPAIVETLLSMLEKTSGRPRRSPAESKSGYDRAILKRNPCAYFRLNDLTFPFAHDANGNQQAGRYEGGVALYLPGPDLPALKTMSDGSRAAHFAGGRMRAHVRGIKNCFSVTLWIWNGLPTDAREVAGYFFSAGPAIDSHRGAISLGIGGTMDNGKYRDRLFVSFGDDQKPLSAGKTQIKLRSWNHIAVVCDGRTIRVYVNGGKKPEIEATLASQCKGPFDCLYVGGAHDPRFSFEGKICNVALFDRVLPVEEIIDHYKTAGK